MVTATKVNAERVYYNFQGKLPPAPIEEEPAPPPAVDDLPKLITDTTLRDGAQDSRIALFPHEARVRYFDLLHRLDNGTGALYTVEGFIFDKLGFRSKEEAIEKYLQPIETALEHGITPRVHLEDCTRADIHGWVIPFMQRVLDLSKGIAKFRICDTIGWGSPDPYAALPWGIPRLFPVLREETGAELEFHRHNDFGLATANSIMSWRFGGKKVNTAFGGLGERTGNCSLEQMIAALIRYYGDPGLDLTALEEMKQLVDGEVTPLPDRAPIIGDVFTTAAGIHQAGVAAQQSAPGGLIYLPFAASLFGRQEVELSRVGSLSGSEGIVSILNREMERSGKEQRFSNTSRAVKQIYDRIQDEYDGRLDESTGRYTGYRRDFYTAEEIVQMAKDLGALE